MEGMVFNTKSGSNAASNNDYTVTLEPGLYAFGSTGGSVKTSSFKFEFHTPEEGNYGYNETNHWLQAEGCEVRYDEVAHTMEENWIVRTPATLEAPGLEYRGCTVCDYEETREIPQITGKQYATTWSADETQHWHECLAEGESGKANGKDVGDHTFVFGFDADGNLGNKCSVCGYAESEYSRCAITSTCTQDTFTTAASKTFNNSETVLLRSFSSSSSNFRAYLGFDLSGIVNSADYSNVDEDSYFVLRFNMVGWNPSTNAIQNLTDDKLPTKFTIKAMKVDHVNSESNWPSSLNWNSATGQYAYADATAIENTFYFDGIDIEGTRKAASFQVLMKVNDLSSFINENGYLVLAIVSDTNNARIVASENTNANYGNAPETMSLYF